MYAHPATLTGILDDSRLPPLTAIGSPRVQPNGLGGRIPTPVVAAGEPTAQAGRRTRRRDDRAHGHGRCMKRKREPSTARPRSRGPVPTGACRNRARPGCRHLGTSVGRGSLSPGLFDLSADGLNDHLATTTCGNTGSFRGSRLDARTRKNARGPVGAGCIRCRLRTPRPGHRQPLALRVLGPVPARAHHRRQPAGPAPAPCECGGHRRRFLPHA